MLLFVLPVAAALVVDPVVVDTAEDSAATVTLKASDPAARFSLAKKPKRGSAVVDDKGALTFTPDKNANGNDELVVDVRAGKEKTRVTVPITIRAVNDLPVVEPMILNTKEDQATRLGLTVKDVDNDKFVFAIGSAAGHGSASVDERGRVSYVPAKDQNGKDRFVVVVDDGAGGKVEAVVDVVVAAVNDAPVVNEVEVKGDEDGVASVVVGASDVDGDGLAFSLGKEPKNGKASIDAKGNLSFSPNKNWHGSDALVVVVRDGGSSTSLELPITIQSINDAPTVEPMALNTREEQSVSLTLTVRDVDGDKPVFSIGKDGAKGKASVDAKGRVSYVPAKDENGADKFVVVVDDGHGGKVDAPVDVVVAAVNDAPAVAAAEFKGDEDGVVEGAVTASDVDGDALAYAVSKAPVHGAAVLDDKSGKLTFTPAHDWHGSDELVVTVKDGATSTSATVKLTVAPVNDPPVIEPMKLATREEEKVSLTLTVKDVDGDAVTFKIGDGGKRGAASVDGKGRVTFSPNKDENGDDKFVVVVNDGHVDALAPVSVAIAPVNDAPVVKAASVAGNEDEAVVTAVDASDVDGDALAYVVDRGPANAAAVIDAKTGKLTITPKKDWHGSDSVVVTVKDGATSTSTTLPITVKPVNDPPVIEAMVLNTREEEPVSLTLTVRDVDGDPVTFAMGGNPARGTASVDAKGRVTYAPAKDQNGKDGFYVVVNDGKVSVNAPVDVVVAPVNDAPVASFTAGCFAANCPVVEDHVLENRFVGVDIDEDPLTYAVVRAPPGRFEASKDGAFKWTPPKDFHGTETVVFDVDDGKLRGRGTLTLTVTPENDAPRLAVRNLSTREDRAGTSLASASDIDGDALKFRVATQGAKGDTVVAASGAITYTPKPDENGDDVVVIAVDDGTTSTEQAMKVTIAPEPDAPRIAKKTWELKEDETEKTTLPGVDVDGDALTFTLIGDGRRGSARLIDAKRGLVEYKPKPDDNGADELRFEVSDGTTKVPGVFPIQLAAVNDAPVAEPLTLTTTEDKQVRGQLVMRDVDGDALKVAIEKAPKNATVKVDGGAKGTFTVEPDKDFAGELSFTLFADEVQPSGLHGKPVVVKVTVTPENDAPTATALTLTTTEDEAVPLALRAADVDGDALTYRVGAKPELGSVDLDARTGKGTYTPRKNTYGSDSFFFVVSDGHGGEARARVAVTVAAVDDAPIAVAGQLNSPHAGRVTGRLIGRDPEGATLTFKILTQPSIGRVTLIDSKSGEYAYTAEGGNKSGRTSFTFVVDDGTQVSEPGTIQIDVQ